MQLSTNEKLILLENSILTGNYSRKYLILDLLRSSECDIVRVINCISVLDDLTEIWKLLAQLFVFRSHFDESILRTIAKNPKFLCAVIEKFKSNEDFNKLEWHFVLNFIHSIFSVAINNSKFIDGIRALKLISILSINKVLTALKSLSIRLKCNNSSEVIVALQNFHSQGLANQFETLFHLLWNILVFITSNHFVSTNQSNIYVTSENSSISENYVRMINEELFSTISKQNFVVIFQFMLQEVLKFDEMLENIAKYVKKVQVDRLIVDKLCNWCSYFVQASANACRRLLYFFIVKSKKDILFEGVAMFEIIALSDIMDMIITSTNPTTQLLSVDMLRFYLNFASANTRNVKKRRKSMSGSESVVSQSLGSFATADKQSVQLPNIISERKPSSLLRSNSIMISSQIGNSVSTGGVRGNPPQIEETLRDSSVTDKKLKQLTPKQIVNELCKSGCLKQIFSYLLHNDPRIRFASSEIFESCMNTCFDDTGNSGGGPSEGGVLEDGSYSHSHVVQKLRARSQLDGSERGVGGIRSDCNFLISVIEQNLIPLLVLINQGINMRKISSTTVITGTKLCKYVVEDEYATLYYNTSSKFAVANNPNNHPFELVRPVNHHSENVDKNAVSLSDYCFPEVLIREKVSVLLDLCVLEYCIPPRDDKIPSVGKLQSSLVSSNNKLLRANVFSGLLTLGLHYSDAELAESSDLQYLFEQLGKALPSFYDISGVQQSFSLILRCVSLLTLILKPLHISILNKRSSSRAHTSDGANDAVESSVVNHPDDEPSVIISRDDNKGVKGELTKMQTPKLSLLSREIPLLYSAIITIKDTAMPSNEISKLKEGGLIELLAMHNTRNIETFRPISSYSSSEQGESMHWRLTKGAYNLWQELFSHVTDDFLLLRGIQSCSTKDLIELYKLSVLYRMPWLSIAYADILGKRLEADCIVAISMLCFFEVYAVEDPSEDNRQFKSNTMVRSSVVLIYHCLCYVIANGGKFLKYEKVKSGSGEDTSGVKEQITAFLQRSLIFLLDLYKCRNVL